MRPVVAAPPAHYVVGPVVAAPPAHYVVGPGIAAPPAHYVVGPVVVAPPAHYVVGPVITGPLPSRSCSLPSRSCSLPSRSCSLGLRCLPPLRLGLRLLRLGLRLLRRLQLQPRLPRRSQRSRRRGWSCRPRDNLRRHPRDNSNPVAGSFGLDSQGGARRQRSAVSQQRWPPRRRAPECRTAQPDRSGPHGEVEAGGTGPSTRKQTQAGC